MTIPGTAQAVFPVQPSAPAGDHKNWWDGRWGFDWASDADAPSDMHFAFTGCTIEAGPAAGAIGSTFVRNPAIGGFPQMCDMLGSS